MEVLKHPNPALKTPALDVEPAVDVDLRKLVRTMAQAMYAEAGIGLAATQIGVAKRVIVLDIDDEIMALCNPVVTSHCEELVVDEEGCLSVPGVSVPIGRYRSLTCEALSLSGDPVTIEAEDMLARVLQHEIDHLDGVLILDRADAESRKAAIKAYNEADRL
jgi:peptide deformylase